MEKPPPSSVIDTGIKEIERIYCIEASPVEHISYVAGSLTSEKARQSCPVVVIDLLSHEVKCRLHKAISNPKTSSKRGTNTGSPAWRDSLSVNRSSSLWEEMKRSWTFSLTSERKPPTSISVIPRLTNTDRIPFRSIQLSTSNNLTNIILHSAGDHFFLGRFREE